jgi:hypothetical protein
VLSGGFVTSWGVVVGCSEGEGGLGTWMELSVWSAVRGEENANNPSSEPRKGRASMDAIVRGNQEETSTEYPGCQTLTNETVQSNPDEEVKMSFRMTRARVWSHAIGGEYCMRRDSSPLTAMCNRLLVLGGGEEMIGSLG